MATNVKRTVLGNPAGVGISGQVTLATATAAGKIVKRGSGLHLLLASADGTNPVGTSRGGLEISYAKAAAPMTEGVLLYYDATADAVTKVATSNTKIGLATEAKTTSGTTIKFFMWPVF